MRLPEPPQGILDPQYPWFSGKVGEDQWMRFKARLTGGSFDGTQYSSTVNLTSADADRLIENLKKDPRGYPQMDDGGGGMRQTENIIAYQEWLVEEYLEKPFRKQVDDKIEERAIESRIKEINEQRNEKAQKEKEKAQSFISGATSFRPGKTISAKTTKISGIIPKRTIPKEISENITPEASQEENESVAPKKVVSSLGRLTLDLVQINDNLDKIKEVIADDYKQTREKNKKEIEDYRKRISNRGRKLSKKDLGSDENSLKDIIKPFIGGFFSGVGGAIRGLAAFNLIEGLMNGDYMQVFKSLMGIGITFIPQIGAMIAGLVLKNLFKGFGKGMIGGRAGPSMRRPAPAVSRVPRIGKFSSALALGAGALALGGAFAASQQGQDGESDDSQTRLEEVAAEQKALTADKLGVIAQSDLKKFQELNQKFEKAVDLLLIKKGGEPGRRSGGGGGADGGTNDASTISNDQVNTDPNVRGSVTGSQFDNAGMVSLLKKVGATDDEAVRLAAIGRHESGGDPSIDTVKSGLDPQMQREYSIGLFQINWKAHKSWLEKMGITNPDQLRDPATNAQAALKLLRESKSYDTWSANKKVTSSDLEEGRKNLKRSVTPPPTPTPTPPREVSSTPSNGGRSIAIVPIPQLTGSTGGGAFTNNGSSEMASVNASNDSDVYGKIFRTGWNIVDLG